VDGKVCDDHGTCNANGTCTCSAGFSPPDCSKPVPPSPPACPKVDGKVCDDHGTCNTNGTCTCSAGFLPPDCSKPVPPTPPPTPPPPECPKVDGKTCDGHGTCNATSAVCTCTRGFSGSNCSTVVPIPCPQVDGKECDGHGSCDTTTGTCKCTDWFQGANCSEPVAPIPCPKVDGKECSAHGACNNLTGDCTCQSGFAGTDCACPSTTSKECDGHGECDSDTGTCKCASDKGYFSAVTGGPCTAYCSHPAPDIDLRSQNIDKPILPIPGFDLSAEHYRCVCDAAESNEGWTGKNCNETDTLCPDEKCTITVDLGRPKSVFDNCMNETGSGNSYCIDRQFQVDLAHYIRTGYFANSTTKSRRALQGIADDDSCTQIGEEKVCFEPSRIQYMREAEVPAVNSAFNENITTAVTFRVASIYYDPKAAAESNFQVIDATEASKRLENNSAIVEACQNSDQCSTRWNIEAPTPRSSDSGLPWWAILLIVLAILCCLLCIILLCCMNREDEAMEEKQAFVHESHNEIRVHDQQPIYAIREGHHDDGDEIPDSHHDQNPDDFVDRKHTTDHV